MDYETHKFLELEENAKRRCNLALAEFFERLTNQQKEEYILDLINAPSDYDYTDEPENERCAKWHIDAHFAWMGKNTLRMCEHYEIAVRKYLIEVFEAKYDG